MKKKVKAYHTRTNNVNEIRHMVPKVFLFFEFDAQIQNKFRTGYLIFEWNCYVVTGFLQRYGRWVTFYVFVPAFIHQSSSEKSRPKPTRYP